MIWLRGEGLRWLEGGCGVFGEKSFTSDVEDKVSNEKSLRTATKTLQGTHLECFGDRE